MTAVDEGLRPGRVRRRIAICGGGVAAVEAVLGLRALLGLAPHIDLVAPNRRFLYEPLAVAEPFGLGNTRLFDLADVAEQYDAQLHVASLDAVDPDRGRIVLTGGTKLVYDHLIVAVGARRRAWLPGALHFTGAADIDSFRAVLERVERGELFTLAFIPPTATGWTLPTYELALLTASWVAERHLTDVELTVITTEEEPLTGFGPATSRAMRDVLGDRGIRLRSGETAVSVSPGALALASGTVLAVEQVIALPRLEGPGLPGLPADESGFIPIDEYARVIGLSDVYAAGDATAFEVKQGGIATYQADAAVESIAASLGAGVTPTPFQRVLRGMLLTGVAPTYLRAALTDEGADQGEVAADPLWWPPTKIAGRYLGPYLAGAAAHGDAEDAERAVTAGGEHHREAPTGTEAGHDKARELALSFALADAGSEDYRSALRWLDVVEHLDGSLPAGYPERRERWRALAER
jgi:sulfide:quinone oxidoreductase